MNKGEDNFAINAGPKFHAWDRAGAQICRSDRSADM